jgi:hypothetical protein
MSYFSINFQFTCPWLTNMYELLAPKVIMVGLKGRISEEIVGGRPPHIAAPWEVHAI